MNNKRSNFLDWISFKSKKNDIEFDGYYHGKPVYKARINKDKSKTDKNKENNENER